MIQQNNTPALRFPPFTEGWVEKKLGEVAEISSGGTPSRTNKNYWNGNIPWITTTLIDFNTIEKAEELITEEGLKNSSAKLFPTGTLLMAMYGQGKTRGKIAILGIEASTNQACGAIITNSDILNSLFLFQNLSKRYDEIRDLSNQGGQENLSGGIIKSIEISFPTLPEQQKIATFFTAIDKKLSGLKQKRTLLEQYKKGVMQQLFSQALRFKNTEGGDFEDWEVKKLGEIGTFFSGGTPLTSKRHYFNGNIPFIRSGEINSDKTVQFISEEGLKNSSSKMVEVGDLLYALYGATSGEVGISKIKGAINQAILCIRTKMDNRFLHNYLVFNKENIINTYLQGGQGNLSADIIKSLDVPIPSTEEQTQIANYLSAIDAKIQGVAAQIEKMEKWKKGLLQQMFV